MLPALNLSTKELRQKISLALGELEKWDVSSRMEVTRDWRIEPTAYAPGICRTPEDGDWVRRVEWSYLSGIWKWSVVNSSPADIHSGNKVRRLP